MLISSGDSVFVSVPLGRTGWDLEGPKVGVLLLELLVLLSESRSEGIGGRNRLKLEVPKVGVLLGVVIVSVSGSVMVAERNR